MARTRPLRYCSTYSPSKQGSLIVAHNVFGQPDATDSATKVPCHLVSKLKMTTRSVLKARRTSSTVVLKTSSSESAPRRRRVISINTWERSASVSCFLSKSGISSLSRLMFVFRATTSSFPATRSRVLTSSRCSLFTTVVESMAAFRMGRMARKPTIAAIAPANPAVAPVPINTSSSWLCCASISANLVSPPSLAGVMCLLIDWLPK